MTVQTVEIKDTLCLPGRVEQSIARLTNEQRFRAQYPLRPLTFVSASADSRKAVRTSRHNHWDHEIIFEKGEFELMSVNHSSRSGGIIKSAAR